MPRSPRVPYGFAVLALAGLLRCGPCGDGGPAKVFEPPQPIDRAVDDAPRPLISAGLSNAPLGEVGPGWPWVVTAAVQHPAALNGPATPTFALTEAAFSIALTDAQGNAAGVAFERLGAPLAPLTLETTSTAALAWRLPPTESAKLPPGAYTLTVAFEGAGVKAKSPPFAVTVSASPDAGRFARELARADDALARGDAAAAEAEVDAILSADPTDVAARTRKGILLERRGDVAGADQAYAAAIDQAIVKEPKAPEGGPRHLFFLKGQLDGGTY